MDRRVDLRINDTPTYLVNARAAMSLENNTVTPVSTLFLYAAARVVFKQTSQQFSPLSPKAHIS